MRKTSGGRVPNRIISYRSNVLKIELDWIVRLIGLLPIDKDSLGHFQNLAK